MIPQYNESSFDNQAISCTKCHWAGKGSDAVVIDFYGLTAQKEVHCPNCDNHIGLLEKDKGGSPGESATDLSFQLG